MARNAKKESVDIQTESIGTEAITSTLTFAVLCMSSYARLFRHAGVPGLRSAGTTPEPKSSCGTPNSMARIRHITSANQRKHRIINVFAANAVVGQSEHVGCAQASAPGPHGSALGHVQSIAVRVDFLTVQLEPHCSQYSKENYRVHGN